MPPSDSSPPSDPSPRGPKRVVQRARDLATKTPLPEGTLAVGAGITVAGIAAYLFIIISARMLGTERTGALSALWALIFIIGPGFFIPIEQEVARALAHRRAQGLGGAPLIKRAMLAGALITDRKSVG